MKFDLYGRFQLEVLREDGAWKVYRIGSGIRALMHDVVLPSDIDEQDIATFLDALLEHLDSADLCVERVLRRPSIVRDDRNGVDR